MTENTTTFLILLSIILSFPITFIIIQIQKYYQRKEYAKVAKEKKRKDLEKYWNEIDKKFG